jgi:hypothetical protein
MGTTAEELRRQLAEERAGISRDLEAIGDRVSPGRMMQRRRIAMRQRVTGIKDRVMGAAEGPQKVGSSAASAASTAASTAADTIRETPDMARRATEGNPLAAGLVAFGTGLVIATLLPETRAERTLTESVQPQLEQLASSAGQAAQEAAEAVKPVAQQAAQELKSSVQDSVATVKDQASQAASETKDHAKEAAGSVREQAQP